MKPSRVRFTFAVLVAAILAVGARLIFSQGALTPPGAPAPTMKSLDEINAAVLAGRIQILPDGATTFTISVPGSYVLAGNVTMTVPAACIQITVDDVKLDLNGHTITGSGRVGAGILAFLHARTTIFNGTVIGFASGISAGNDVHIHGVKAAGNGNTGIFAGDNSLLENCIANGNNINGNSAGIAVGNGCTVKNCIASANNPTTANTGATGIIAGTDCTIINNTARANTGNGSGAGTGIRTGAGWTISGNTCNGNTSTSSGDGNGINAGDACAISGNSCRNNTGGLTGDGNGIAAGLGGTIINNTCNSNTSGTTGGTGYGITTFGNNTIQGNNCTDNRGLGGNSSGWGIFAPLRCLVRENNCDANTATGTGTARGIVVGFDCNVENNHCTLHYGGQTGYGIEITGDGNTIISNRTSKNSPWGIRFPDDTNTVNRSELNRCLEALPANAPAYPGGSGVGDLADINY